MIAHVVLVAMRSGMAIGKNGKTGREMYREISGLRGVGGRGCGRAFLITLLGGGERHAEEGGRLGGAPVLLDAALRMEKLVPVDGSRAVQVGDAEQPPQLERIVPGLGSAGRARVRRLWLGCRCPLTGRCGRGTGPSYRLPVLSASCPMTDLNSAKSTTPSALTSALWKSASSTSSSSEETVGCGAFCELATLACISSRYESSSPLLPPLVRSPLAAADAPHPRWMVELRTSFCARGRAPPSTCCELPAQQKDTAPAPAQDAAAAPSLSPAVPACGLEGSVRPSSAAIGGGGARHAPAIAEEAAAAGCT